MQYFISLFDKSDDLSPLSPSSILQSLLNSLSSSLLLPPPSLLLTLLPLPPRLSLLSFPDLLRLLTSKDLRRDFSPLFPGLRDFLVGESGGIISGFTNNRGETLNLSREIRADGGPSQITIKVEKGIRHYLRSNLLKGLKGGSDARQVPFQIVLLVNELIFYSKLTVLLVTRKPILGLLTEISDRLTDFLGVTTEIGGKTTEIGANITENGGKTTESLRKRTDSKGGLNEIGGKTTISSEYGGKFTDFLGGGGKGRDFWGDKRKGGCFRDGLVFQMLRQMEILQDFVNNNVDNANSFEYLALPKFSMEIGKNSPFYLRFKQIKESGQNDLILACVNELANLGRGGDGGGRKAEGGKKEDSRKREESMKVGRKAEGIGEMREEGMKKGSVLRSSVISLGVKKFEGNLRFTNATVAIANRKRKEEGGEGGKREQKGWREDGGMKEEDVGRKEEEIRKKVEGEGKKEEVEGKKEERGGREEVVEEGGRREEEEGRFECFDVILSIMNYKLKYGFDISCGNEGFVWTNSASRAVFGLVTVMTGGGAVLSGVEGIGKRETIKVNKCSCSLFFHLIFYIIGYIYFMYDIISYDCLLCNFIDVCWNTWPNAIHEKLHSNYHRLQFPLPAHEISLSGWFLASH